MLLHRQAIFESKGDKLSSSAESRIRTHQGLRHQIASRLNAHWQTDWAIEDQAKNLNSQPVPMISEHSAHLTPQPFGIRTWLWQYTWLLLLISMPWHRQAIFESEGDKLSSSAESRIRTHQGLRHQIASRLNAHWQTDWAIEDQAKNLNSTARPYDQRAFSPLDPTTVWHSHLALAIYLFVVVNLDARFLTIRCLKGRKPRVFTLCSQGFGQLWTCQLNVYKKVFHSYVMIWKTFPRYWSSPEGIHRSRVVSPHRELVMKSFVFALVLAWRNSYLNQLQSHTKNSLWFETYSSHCSSVFGM